jgi:phage recombination protein Bet
MGQVAHFHAPAQSGVFTDRQLDLIRRTVANDCNSQEFDLFCEVARRTGLDPIRKQISALVFNKNKPDRRRMAIITTIDGFRAIASRSGRYRPDEEEADYVYDEDLKSRANPLGLVKASVTIWIAEPAPMTGWKPAKGWAYWDEFADQGGVRGRLRVGRNRRGLGGQRQAEEAAHAQGPGRIRRR